MKKVNNINMNPQHGGDNTHIINTTTTSIDPNDRPTVTYSDTLQTMEKIQDKLRGYERVPNIELIEIGTSIRYITWKYGKMRFCIGGILIAKHPNYCKLTNFRKDIQWNVKKEHIKNKYDKNDTFKTIFYQKCTNMNNSTQGSSDNQHIDKQPKYTTIQSREIEKFYRQRKQERKRREWLKTNIYNQTSNIRFF